MNRVGDWGFSIGLFAIFWVFGNLDYTTVFSLTPFVDEGLITIISICLLIAAMGKSAQIGLHTWLPEAMEGPTPVSALIHAATMVTAGVYLLLRSSPILEYGSTPLILITWVGALTAFFAATTGLLQNDLKRVIAYSTCSQLGYMVFACGLSNYSIGIFHLVNHAFFKALLFLSAGAVIHALNDEQDMRKMGGLVNLLPFTYTMILIGSLSLMALPFLTGFYSKDLILEAAFGQYLFTGNIAFWLGTISAVFTAFYSLRLLALTFLTYPNGPRISYLSTHEAPLIMAIPLVILALFSIFFGYLTRDLFVGLGSDFFGNSLFVHPNHLSLIEAEFGIPLWTKLLPLVGSLSGALVALIIYQLYYSTTNYIVKTSFGRGLYRFFNQKYFFDNFANYFIINPALTFGFITSKILDKGVLELLGPRGLTQVLTTTSNKIVSFDTGSITQYALFIFISAVGLIVTIFYLEDPRYFILYLITTSFIPLNKKEQVKSPSIH